MKSLPPSSLLFAGETFDGRDDPHPRMRTHTGDPLVVRVRIVPARHLLTPDTGYLDLADTGKEAELLELCVEHPGADGTFVRADADFIDSLDDASHVRLVEEAHRLNFTRAISQAERLIANGAQLRPMKEKMAATLVAPMEAAFRSLTSSLTTALTKPAPAKQL